MAAPLSTSYVLKCRLLLPILVIVVQTLSVNSSHIEVGSDGGYTKVVVAVSDRVRAENKPLSELKTILTNFFKEVSKGIYMETQNRLFLSEIQVLLSRKWFPSYDVMIHDATFESFHEADIRLDGFNPIPGRGDLYTNQPRGCGMRGEFIFTSPHFLYDWEVSKNETLVHRFVREWLKLRFGIFEETDHKLHANSNKLQNALCKSNITWKIMQFSDDLKNIQSNNEKAITEITSPKIRFVTVVRSVVLVIDPLLLRGNFTTKGTHMLNLALRKFSSYFSIRDRFGCVIADSNIEYRPMKTWDELLFDIIANLVKNRYNAERNIPRGISKAIEMLLANGAHSPHLILIGDGAKLPSEIFESIFQHIKEIKFFLWTWTLKHEKPSFTSDVTEYFIKNNKRSIWVNIKTNAEISNCDQNSRIQTEDALELFYQKFLHDDFYSDKIKIQDAVTKPNQIAKFILPNSNSTIMFNIFSCDFDADNQKSLLTINKNTIDLNLSEDVPKSLLTSYQWDSNLKEKSHVEYKLTFSNSPRIGSSVWTKYNLIKNNLLSTILDAFIEVKSNSEQSSPYSIYAFNPNKYSITCEFSAGNENNFTIQLRDNGNGDPDVIKGDGIYTRYLIAPSAAAGQFFSAKVIARDNINNIAAQIFLGTVYLPVLDLTKFPPNRICDLQLKSLSENSAIAILNWTAPGGYYDQGRAYAYYLYCDKNYNSLKSRYDMSVLKNDNNKIEKHPTVSGSEETHVWTVPSSNTTYYCVLLSKNEHNVWSDISNVVSIYPSSTTNSGEPSSTHPNSKSPNLIKTSDSPNEQSEPADFEGKVRLGAGEIIGIVVAILLVIVLVLVFIFIIRLKKHKLIFASKRFARNSTKQAQNIEMTSNKKQTLTDQKVYENPETAIPCSDDLDDGYLPYATSEFVPTGENLNINSQQFANVDVFEKTDDLNEITPYGTTTYNTQQPLLPTNEENNINPEALYSKIDKSKKKPKTKKRNK